MMKAATTASAALSVGVAMPKTIPPMMTKGIDNAGRPASMAWRLSLRVARAVCGKSTKKPRIAIETRKAPDRIRPGMIPAMNRSPIPIWARTPKMTNSMEGGMIGESSPPAAVSAPAKARS